MDENSSNSDGWRRLNELAYREHERAQAQASRQHPWYTPNPNSRPTGCSVPWNSNSASALPAGPSDTKACPCGCGETVHALGSGPIYVWGHCTQREAQIARMNADYDRQQADNERRAYAEWKAEQPLVTTTATGLEGMERFTLDRFRRDWLELSPDGTHPVDVATAWLDAALAYGPVADASDPASPAAALYFYSPLDAVGCGKTHLARALAWIAVWAGWRVLVIDEKTLINERWGCEFRTIQAMVARYRTADLVVFDDLGKRQPTPGTQEVWDEFIDVRQDRGGWTVYTSNYVPTELLDQGVINRPTYSRLIGHTGHHVVRFVGQDRRLGGVQ